MSTMVGSDEVAGTESVQQPPQPQPQPVRRRRGRWVRPVAAAILLTGAVAMVGMTVTEQETLDKIAGNTKVEVQKYVAAAPHAAASALPGWLGGTPGSSWFDGSGTDPANPEYVDSLPVVLLGASGGEAELDACDGTFTKMIEYADSMEPALYSAHNTCDGDIILGWELGQHARVAGSDVVYEVVEERQGLEYSDAGLLAGMPGELVLQTCFYGEERMRFLALSPVQASQA